MRRSAISVRGGASSIDRTPRGESYRDCVEKIRSFLDDVAREFDGRRVLVIAHSAQRWALRHLLEGPPLEELVDAPFEWQEGCEYLVPSRAHE